jgi:hypothetical protein
MAAGHLQVEKAFNTRSLRSKQLATGGQTLTYAIHRSSIGGLDLFITTSAGFELLGLGRWWVGQRRVLLLGGAGGSGVGVAKIGSGLSNPKADEVLTKQSQIYHQTSQTNRRYIMNKELHLQRGFLYAGLLQSQCPWFYNHGTHCRWRGHTSQGRGMPRRGTHQGNSHDSCRSS